MHTSCDITHKFFILQLSSAPVIYLDKTATSIHQSKLSTTRRKDNKQFNILSSQIISCKVYV